MGVLHNHDIAKDDIPAVLKELSDSYKYDITGLLGLMVELQDISAGEQKTRIISWANSNPGVFDDEAKEGFMGLLGKAIIPITIRRDL